MSTGGGRPDSGRHAAAPPAARIARRCVSSHATTTSGQNAGGLDSTWSQTCAGRLCLARPMSVHKSTAMPRQQVDRTRSHSSRGSASVMRLESSSHNTAGAPPGQRARCAASSLS